MTEQAVESKPKVYIVVLGHSALGDIDGVLVTVEDGPLWSHMSSDIEWLRNDLTTTFTDRKATLEAKYPDGYDVVLIDGTPLPADIARYFGVQ